MIIETEIEVINKLGLHARAGAKLAKLCASFESNIKIIKGEKCADGKSIMSILMLAASQGCLLKLIVDGKDASAASNAIMVLFKNYFDEGE